LAGSFFEHAALDSSAAATPRAKRLIELRCIGNPPTGGREVGTRTLGAETMRRQTD
jgi:hypothetical protein